MDIKVYGANWCVDCINVKNFLDSKGIKYNYIDITDNKKAITLVEEINNGKRIIPTLIINGISYANPSISVLIKLIDLDK